MLFGLRRRLFLGTWAVVPMGAPAFVIAVLEPPSRPVPPCSLPPLSGLDTLRATAPDLILRGMPGPDLLVGQAGEDRLVGGEGNDVLRGGPNRDLLDGGPGDDVLEGGDGDDVLAGGDGRDFLFGERGDDRLDGDDGPDVLDGGPGADYLQGGAGDDLLDGCDGDDTVLGGAGNDDLDGNDGFDFLDGGDGNDKLSGGDENDVLWGGAGADSLSGGDGNEQLDGGIGDDFLSGDDGDDGLRGGAGNDGLAGRDGNDYLDGDVGDDVLNGGDGDDVLQGGVGADTMLGSSGKDRLSGGAGNDVQRGGDGDDLMDGDAGDDALSGGTGTDVIHGGDGNDGFLLRAGDVDSAGIEIIDGGTNRDTARVEADSLVLSGFAPADIRPLALSGIRGFEIVDPLTGGTYVITSVEKLVFLQVVPYVAGGGESALTLVNGAAVQLVGRLEFVGADGRPMPTPVGADTARAVQPLQLPAHGSSELITRPPRDGAIWLYTDQPIGAFVRTVLPGGAGGVVPAGPLVDFFGVPVVLDRNRGATSGFAVSNDRLATVLRIWLYTASGVEQEATNLDLASRGQAVVFARDIFPREDRIDGAMSVEGGPLVAIGLQVRDGQLTLGPALALAPRAGTGPTTLPHIVTGGGYSTTVTLTGLPNVGAVAGQQQGDTAKNGRIAFFDDRGRPLTLDIAGLGAVAEVPFTLRAGASRVVASTGRGLRVEGSARITTEKGAVAVTARLAVPNAGTVDFPATRGLHGFVAPVRRDSARRTTTLLALSAGSTAATVDLAVHGPNGQRIAGGHAQLTVPANGHSAQSLERLFPQASTGRFRGSVVAVVSGGSVSAAVFELRRDSAAAIPVTRLR